MSIFNNNMNIKYAKIMLRVLFTKHKIFLHKFGCLQGGDNQW